MKNLSPTTYNLQPTHGFTLLNPAKREFRQRRNYLTGFTLVEMLVSISVFMVVMTVAAGSLLSIIDANGKAQSLKSAVNNLNFAIESMGKQIREGGSYTGGMNCSPPDTCISFTSSKDLLNNGSNDTYYKFIPNNPPTNPPTGYIGRCLKPASSCSNDSNFTPMTTAKGVNITDMKFYISNIAPQRVLITVSGEAGTKTKLKTKFNLQTTISQRSY